MQLDKACGSIAGLCCTIRYRVAFVCIMKAVRVRKMGVFPWLPRKNQAITLVFSRKFAMPPDFYFYARHP